MKCTTFSELDLKNKRVFLRVDLNVPLVDGSIENDFRIKAIIPTIDAIIKRGGKVVLATHMGRPEVQSEDLSTAILASWFSSHGYKIKFERSLNRAEQNSKKNVDEILLLENLRFFPGERTDCKIFAQKLARLADCYVNDAFALIHRPNTSVTLLPRLFSPENRSIGLLMEKEISALENFVIKPKHQTTMILGGAKIDDKIPFIEHFLNKADSILICPPLSFTFLAAQGKQVGTSLINKHLIKKAQDILNKSKNSKANLILPIDYTARSNPNGAITTINPEEFTVDMMGINVGQKTISIFKDQIENSKSIFANGLPGFLDQPETLIETEKILQLISNSNAYSVIGGGDSIAITQKLGFESKISFLSTGGGAAIAYLSNIPLPGLSWCK